MVGRGRLLYDAHHHIGYVGLLAILRSPPLSDSSGVDGHSIIVEVGCLVSPRFDAVAIGIQYDAPTLGYQRG